MEAPLWQDLVRAFGLVLVLEGLAVPVAAALAQRDPARVVAR